MASLLNVKSGIPAEHVHDTQAITATANGVIGIRSGTVILNHATVVIAATFKELVIGAEYLIWHAGGGTAAHTVTLPAGMTFDGTNNTATLNALNEMLLIRIVSATRAVVVVNNGSVALSAV